MTMVPSLRTAFRRSFPRPRHLFTRLTVNQESKLCLDGKFFSFEAIDSMTKSNRMDDTRFGLAAASAAAAAAAATTAILMTQSEEERKSIARIFLTESDHNHNHHSPADAIHFLEPGTVEDIQVAVSQIRQVVQGDTETTHSKDTIGPETGRKANQDFPSLTISTFNNNCGEGEFELNALEPIPIENDFFKGKILINVRPNQRNRVTSASKKDLFEILMQGQFKRVPRGTLYVGAELADADFQFNRLFRGLTGVLLGLLAQRIGDDMQFSLGEKAADGKRQLPYISFPIQTAMSTFVVTPPGETPPAMRSTDFEDTTETNSPLKKAANVTDWKTDGSIYSMAFRGSGIDLTTWRVIEPFDVSLHRFWGKAPLRLVIYEKGEEPTSTTAKVHDQLVQDANNYLLGFQVEFLSTDQGTDSAEANRNKETVHATPLGFGSI